MNIKALFERLSNWHWSPCHPSAYIIYNEDGSQAGVGRIAYQNYGAFNLAWGNALLPLNTHTGQLQLLSDFSKYRHFTAYKMGEQTVGDWLCMLQPEAFISQLEKTPVPIASITRELLGVADRAASKKVSNDV